MSELTVGEFAEYLKSKAPEWVSHGGWRFRYMGEYRLNEAEDDGSDE